MESPNGTGQSPPNLGRKEHDTQPQQKLDHPTEIQQLKEPPEVSETIITKQDPETSEAEIAEQGSTTEVKQLEGPPETGERDITESINIETTEHEPGNPQTSDDADAQSDTDQISEDQKNSTFKTEGGAEPDPADTQDNNRGFMHIPIILNGRKIVATIDTGSAISVISPTVYNKIRDANNRKLVIEGPMLNLRLVDRSTLAAAGNVEGKIQIGNSKTLHHKLVVADTTTPFIKGTDFLLNETCVLNMGDSTLQIHGTTEQMLRANTFPSDFQISLTNNKHKIHNTVVTYLGHNTLNSQLFLRLSTTLLDCTVTHKAQYNITRLYITVGRAIQQLENLCILTWRSPK